jgi:hypothetical protein
MDSFTLRQILLFLCAVLLAALLAAAGTIYVPRKFILFDPTAPLSRQGGLSPSQQIHKNKALFPPPILRHAGNVISCFDGTFFRKGD